jgi:hypothetical protein
MRLYLKQEDCTRYNPPIWLTIAFLLIGIILLMNASEIPKENWCREIEKMTKIVLSLLFVCLSGICHTITK